MSARGDVRAFQAKWTEPDPDNPGQRRTRTASTWTYRFEFHKKRYLGADNYQTKRDALDAGEKRKAEVRRGLEADPSKTTFAVLDRLLAAEKLVAAVPSTATNIGTCLNRLRKVFKPEERLQDLRRARIIEALGQLRALGFRDSTIRLTFVYLKQAMHLAFEEGLLFAVPRFPVLHVEARQETILPHQLEQILDAHPSYWRRYYLVADEVGWRARSELRSRQWPHVDFEAGWLNLDAAHSKTRRARSFPMTERLRALLVEQRAWVETLERELGRIIPWVFPQPNGKKLPMPQDTWDAAMRKAGFGKLDGRSGPWSSSKVPHDIRRSVLRRWAASGASLDVRMAAAGHSSSHAHVGYVGGDEASLKAFAERIDEVRKEQAEKVTAITKA